MMTVHGDQAGNINWLSQLPLGRDFFRAVDAKELGDVMACDRVPFEKKGGITNEIRLLIYLELDE